MNIFITGTAGFIGFHLARRLLAEGHVVHGFDGLTDYYDVRLKRARHALLEASANFTAIIGQLENADLLKAAIRDCAPDIVVHLAAQAGVRYSIEHPQTYVSSNLIGTFNLLEALRATPVQHAILASTSSIYAATKRGTEAMAHSYAHLFGIPTTLTRFFTVYGPWGRPDMAPIKFASAIEAGRAIDVYGEGNQSRDFTYIDDVVEAVTRLLTEAPVAGFAVDKTDSISPVAPWRTVNIAGGQPVPLLDFIAAFEAALGKPALKNFVPMQPGDVSATLADTALLRALTDFVPAVPVSDGVAKFCAWYRTEYAGRYT